ncbi:MAG: hypothetical protein KBB39_12520 [Phycicoccus sp.]|nr:hypothetical protein [Phycicoccus sp.]
MSRRHASESPARELAREAAAQRCGSRRWSISRQPGSTIAMDGTDDQSMQTSVEQIVGRI